MVFTNSSSLRHYADNGIPMNADISKDLILSIFEKNSPLHDGAVIIADRKILAASSILPTSDNPDLPRYLGTRHRAAIGITEVSDALAILVSEESGKMAISLDGQIQQNVSLTDLQLEISKSLKRIS